MATKKSTSKKPATLPSGHTMKHDERMGAPCLHWICQHEGEEVSTYDWLNSFMEMFYRMVQRRSGKQELEDMVRWTDAEAITRGMGVEDFLNKVCEEEEERDDEDDEDDEG